MSDASDSSALAPFTVRSFRFQWPGDLAMSWAYEMENIVLGWYVLVETQSVLLLTLYGSLQYIGTLLSPMFGVMGNRIGTKRLLCGMRTAYALLAMVMMALALTGMLTPLYVFIIAALMGLVRPSDLVMRYALIGETMRAGQLLVAASISRTTQDSARVMGALSGAALVAALGMGPVYVVIACLYSVSLILTLQVANAHKGQGAAAHTSVWRDLREGVAYSLSRPVIMAAMWLALLVNLTAFPLTSGLLPYVAKEVFHTDQTGLGYLAASFAFGSLAGSITLSRIGHAAQPARYMVVFCGGWYAMLAVFTLMPTVAAGCAALMCAGVAQSLGMVSMSGLLLRATSSELRSRVMGLRMLMIYSLPLGLLAAGPLINQFGFRSTGAAYCVFGIVCTAWIGWHWRAHVWRADAQENKR